LLCREASQARVSEGPEKTTRGMNVSQSKFLNELDLRPEVDLMRLSSNSV
jgi:hypothetical protein